MTKSVALYWSPNACLPIIIGCFHPVTNLGTFLTIMGSLNTVPPRMFLMVPFGLFHIYLRLNYLSLASSGVIVAHLIPTLHYLIAFAASIVTWSFVLSLFYIPRSKYWMLRSIKGKINRSLIHCHITLVISSPSISTTGLVTLIFLFSILNNLFINWTLRSLSSLYPIQ